MPKEKPNILVIWGDDIGIANLSCYSHGLMGYRTPNIDRIAKEGMLFTDSYGEQSCTAGRSAFITGQSVYRTGLSKRGLRVNGGSFRNHIDGYDLVPYLKGETDESPRRLFVYFSDDGDVLGLRYDNWKLVFMEQRAAGTMRVWGEPFVPLRVPSCSTCAPIRSTARMSHPTPATTGSSITAT